MIISHSNDCVMGVEARWKTGKIPDGPLKNATHCFTSWVNEWAPIHKDWAPIQFQQ